MGRSAGARPLPWPADDGGEDRRLADEVGRSNASLASLRSRRLGQLLVDPSPNRAWNQLIQIQEQVQFEQRNALFARLEALHLKQATTLYRVSIALTWVTAITFALTTVGAAVALFVEPSLGWRLLALGGASTVGSGAGAVATRHAGNGIRAGIKRARSVHQSKMPRSRPTPGGSR